MKKEFGDQFILTLITNDSHLATIANECGVDRIGVDLEILNKLERQKGLDTRLSVHTVADLQCLATVIDKSKLFVRINSIHQHTEKEINEVIEAGAQYVMLPYFKTAREIDLFVRLVDGRASPIALLETAAAAIRVQEMVRVAGLHEVMLGLNDLRLSFGVHNHFEILCSPLLDTLANEIISANLRFTLGGVAPPTQPFLPVNPDLVLAQYPRLGAHGAWIARSCIKATTNRESFLQLVESIRHRLNELSLFSTEKLENMRAELEMSHRLSEMLSYFYL